MKCFLLILGCLCLSLFSGCKTKTDPTFDQHTLERARAILDASNGKWPDVDGFLLRPSGYSSPELWALNTIRYLGEPDDAARCLQYMERDNPVIKLAAEESFITLTQQEMSYQLIQFLESGEDRLRKLALAYCGWKESELSEDELRILAQDTRESVRNSRRRDCFPTFTVRAATGSTSPNILLQ